MIYRQRIEGCFQGGLETGAYEAALARTEAALEAVRAAHDDGSLPLLRLPKARGDLAALAPLAEGWRARFSEVVVLGTGGSSLGGQTLYALADRGFGPVPGTPRLRFLDNVDPDTFEAFFAGDLSGTGILAVSKSGSTAETMTQLLTAIDAIRRAGGDDAPARHIAVITEPANNPLRRLAVRFGFETLDHDPKVGGRYSALSLVGLLPAMIAGLDAVAVREGAAEVLDPVLAGAKPADVAPAVGAALSVALSETRGIGATVLMPYCDRLADFGLWFRQLWAESLGKDGKGTTPIRAVGTVDQHSQLQLYLAGPADKLFTVVVTETEGQGPEVPRSLADDPALGYLAGKRMGDLFAAEARATAETLIRNRRPTRILDVPRIDERAMGALMMHFMLETIVAAHLLGVDPFDQPAVEEGKVLTRAYLAGESPGESPEGAPSA